MNARKADALQNGGSDGAVGPVLAPGGLAEFSRMLSVFTHCSKLKVPPPSAGCCSLQRARSELRNALTCAMPPMHLCISSMPRSHQHLRAIKLETVTRLGSRQRSSNISVDGLPLHHVQMIVAQQCSLNGSHV